MTPSGDDLQFDWRRGGAAAGALLATLILLAMVVLVAMSNQARDRALDGERHAYDVNLLTRAVDASISRSEAGLGRFVLDEEVRTSGPVYADERARAMGSAPDDDPRTRSTTRRTKPMKLTTTTQVSVDGVMQGPGAPVASVAERGAFERSGWAHFDNEAGSVMDEIFRRADAFVFGRRTYEIFAGSWGTWDDPGDSPIWTALNTLPKYVALTTPFDPTWANTTALSGDVAATIRDLKAKAGGELQVHGSGALARWLLENDLVDEMNLFTFPVIVGQGTRLFPDRGPDRALDLVDSRATPTGVTIQVYRPIGRPRYATATPPSST